MGMTIIVSFDGLSSRDFDYISELDNFKEFIGQASYSKNVRSVYPSLTYPCHASIVTGKYPRNHGIVNNSLLDPKRKSPDWYWQRDYLKSTTIFDLAIDRGDKVMSLSWPVTARSRIQLNMPEIFPNRPWQSQVLVSALNGSPLFQYKLNRRFGHIRRGIDEPNLSDFIQECLLYGLKTYRPDLSLVHFIDLDWTRHKYGFYSREARQALKRHDKRLGEIVDRLKDMGLYQSCNLVVLGDHSSLDAEKIIFLNNIFLKEGLITVKNQKIVDYKVIGKTCDGSSYVYIKDRTCLPRVREILYGLKDRGMGLERIYEGEELLGLGVDQRADFILEAREGYYFMDDFHRGASSRSRF